MVFMNNYDIAIIGGGFYGAFVATQLAKQFPHYSVTIIEKEDNMFKRASSTNQGQVHRGYVYSNDPNLAKDCQKEAPVFEAYFPDAIDRQTESYYAVHKDSEITPEEFEKFCSEVNLPLTAECGSTDHLVGGDIVKAYTTPEKTFNSQRVQEKLLDDIKKTKVEVLTAHAVKKIKKEEDGSFELVMTDKPSIRSKIVINATFADINRLHDESELSRVSMRSDVFLHFLITLPERFKNTSISIVRGNFCFMVPSTFRNGHLLASATHRKTDTSKDGYVLEDITNKEIMRRYKLTIDDCSKYVPVLKDATYKGYTIGTRVAFYDSASDSYSSKVMFFEDYDGLNNYHVLLGGKVSAIFDALEPALNAVKRFASASNDDSYDEDGVFSKSSIGSMSGS
jgi:glycine/D-amino acid oxidase-like deaminating enzyme